MKNEIHSRCLQYVNRVVHEDREEAMICQNKASVRYRKELPEQLLLSAFLTYTPRDLTHTVPIY
jgi:hypothetical protein